MLIRGFKKWPRNQQIALPILSVFAFGALFNQMQARNSEPVSIHVENPRIIDGDTLETLDKKRVRLSGIDAPDEDGKGNVPKIAAQLYLEELVKQHGGMDCTSDFQDEKLTIDTLASGLPCLEATLLRKLHRPRGEMALVDLRAVEVAGQSRAAPKSITYVERHGNPYDLDVSH